MLPSVTLRAFLYNHELNTNYTNYTNLFIYLPV